MIDRTLDGGAVLRAARSGDVIEHEALARS
jgi:hypothetical protein